MHKPSLFIFIMLLFGLSIPLLGMKKISSQGGTAPYVGLLLPSYTPPPSLLGLQQRVPILETIIQNLANGHSWGNVDYFQRGAVQRYARETKREHYVLTAIKNYLSYKQIDAIIQQLEDDVPWERLPEKDREAIQKYAIEHQLSGVLDAIGKREEV